jgi:hypothetical protein
MAAAHAICGMCGRYAPSTVLAWCNDVAMPYAESKTSTIAQVLVSVVAVVLLVLGGLDLFDGDWSTSDLVVVLGLLGVLWVVQAQLRDSGWRRPSPWLVLLIALVVLVVLALSVVGVVCGDEQGFSCGG